MAAELLAHPVLLAAAAFLASLLLTGLAARYARRHGLIDHPGERHSHTQATPRGGGAGPVLTLLVALAWLAGLSGSAWPMCALPGLAALAAIGWWDDHRPLSPWLRLAVQLAVSCILVACLQVPGPDGDWVALGIAALFATWMTNLYNFMDGSNGMAGLQGVFGGLVLALLYHGSGDLAAMVLALVLAGSCLGFLPWNLIRPRVFMGDVGSGPIGFLFAALLLYGVISGQLAVPVAWLVMLVFVCDTSLTLLLRVMRGERWYTPHKQHLYQRLIERGWSHGRVALLYQSVNLALVLPGIAVAVSYPALAAGVAAALSFGLALVWLLAMRKLGVLSLAG